MIGDPTLGEIVGADPLVAHPRAHLTPAQAGDLGVQLLLLHFIELGGQHPHTFFPVLHLASLLLASHHNARRLVNQPDGGTGFIDVLTAGTGSPVDLHLDVRRIDLHVHLFHFRQHRHGGRGGVNPAAGLRLRHPLNPVNAGFVLHPRISSPAVDDEVRLLHAPQLGFIVIEQLHAPSLLGGIHGVHPKQTVGKQGAFLSAHTAPNFHNHVLFVVGVFGQQQNLQFFVEFFLGGLGGGIGFLAQLLHLRVVHQLLGVRHVLFRLTVSLVARHDGLQVAFFPKLPGRLLGIGVKIRLLRPGAELLVFIADGL